MAHPFQTTVQNVNAIRFGSAQVAITGTIGATANTTYVDLGVAQGITFAEEVTRAWIGGDNAELTPRVTKQRTIISGTFLEYEPNAWETMRGDVDEYTTSGAAGPTTKIIYSGGKRAQSAFQIRLLNSIETTDPSTRKFQMHAWKCYDNGSLQFAFQPDEDENPMGIPFEFVAVPDTTRSVGEQLYRINDMQSTS